MKLQINGETLVVKEAALLQWLENQGVNPEEIVIEYNGKILGQEKWVETYLQEGDRIEILRFVGGG